MNFNKLGYINMKKTSTTILVLIFSSLLAYSQDNERLTRTQIDNEKTVFFTRQLGLTQEQAPEFWRLYNEFQREDAELRQKEEELVERGMAGNLTESQYAQIQASIAANDKRKRELRENFNKQLEKVLTPKQMILFCKANKEYRGMLLQKLRPAKSAPRK